MPTRSFATLRRWLAPWVVAAFVLTACLVALAGPPVALWASMLATTLAVMVLAGCVAALLHTVATILLRMPIGSRGSFGLAALAGATVPLLPFGAWVGDPVLSGVVYAVLALIAAWRLVPAEGADTPAGALSVPARAT